VVEYLLCKCKALSSHQKKKKPQKAKTFHLLHT
jgi:hypothetical protein